MDIFAKSPTSSRHFGKILVQDTGNMPVGKMREGSKDPESESGTGGNGECPPVEADESRTRASREVLRTLTARSETG
jgi:hypothetical protein